MGYKININSTTCCCGAPKKALLAWGYPKLIVDFVQFFCLIYLQGVMLIIYIFYPSTSEAVVLGSVGALNILTITDIVLNFILVVGTHKNNAYSLKKYYIYCKVFCLLTPLLAAIFAIAVATDLLDQYISEMMREQVIQWIVIQLCIMFVSLIFQTCLMPVLRNEIDKIEISRFELHTDDVIDEKDKVCNSEISLKIEETKIKETEENDVKEDVVTTCEKEKLVE